MLINSLAQKICQILQQAGFQAFIVGGCVRDLLLNINPKDWDITTNASPEEIMELFPNTIPTGLQHGTITVVMGKGIENHFEVTTFRIDGEYKDGRRPENVSFVNNIEEDLARRDLTINAIAYDPIIHKLIDPFNGLKDIKFKIIKAVGDPSHRFQEDGLRIMRAARFAARFGYNISIPTFISMKNNLEILKKVSKERIKDELCKTLMSNNPSYGIYLLQQCGALKIVCPYLASNLSFNYILPFLDRCSGELETKIAFLYSKCASAKLVKKELINLKFSNKEIKKIIFLHQLLIHYNIFLKKDTVLAYKCFMAVVKNHSHESWQDTLKQFIKLTEAMGMPSKLMFAKYYKVVVPSKKEMNINGNDLLAAGMSPGPQIKNILNKCYLKILKSHHYNNKEFLLYFANK